MLLSRKPGLSRLKRDVCRDVVPTKKVWERIKKWPFYSSVQLILKENLKKVWERRSHAFPPRYTPGLMVWPIHISLVMLKFCMAKLWQSLALILIVHSLTISFTSLSVPYDSENVRVVHTQTGRNDVSRSFPACWVHPPSVLRKNLSKIALAVLAKEEVMMSNCALAEE